MTFIPFKMSNGVKLQGVPLLLKRGKVYECKAGHTLMLGDAPYQVALPFGVNERGEPQQLNSGPVCPVCFLTWLAEQFPLQEQKESENPNA